MKNLLVLLIPFFCLVSCGKKDNAAAGKGGSATVNVYPQHHGIAKRLINVKVWIKYNTADAPTNGIYDDSATCTNHDSLVSCAFPGLRNGNYYFYATGFDTSVNQSVRGGIPYTISGGMAPDLLLPVSE